MAQRWRCRTGAGTVGVPGTVVLLLLSSMTLVACSDGSGDAAVEEPVATSRCALQDSDDADSEVLVCSQQATTIGNGAGRDRRVIFEVPVGEPPAAGWPVVMIFQGSRVPIDDFRYPVDAAQGAIHEGQTIAALLDVGYAVLAPAAPFDQIWQTNLPGLRNNYTSSTDYRFLSNVLAAIEDGSFGSLDAGRLYATGISSGGYQTSRMAQAFPGRFRALAVISASWATCAGPICSLPDRLPQEHPPTLFVHGLIDETVPWETMDRYYDRLLHEGIKTDRVLEPLGGHEWFESAPSNILAWFDAHP